MLVLLSIYLPEVDTPLGKIKKVNLFSALLEHADSTSTGFHLKDVIGLPPETKKVAINTHLKIDDENIAPLASFFRALHETELTHQPLRIAYFGDSIIEGDLITQEIRKKLQERFGGRGVGYVPITAVSASFRATIKHTFSSNWETESFMTKNYRHLPLGFSGFVFSPHGRRVKMAMKDSALDSLGIPTDSTYIQKDEIFWVKYKHSTQNNLSTSFNRVRLFYSNAKPSCSCSFAIDKGTKTRVYLQPGRAIQQLVLSQNRPFNEIELQFSPTDSLLVYGVVFDEPEGVYVDNYSIRGYAGNQFTKIPSSLLKEFHRYLDYRLIVLQYGANVSNPKTTDYTNYKNSMVRSIRHLQQTFPNTPILVVSASDKSINENGCYVTSPDIPLLVEAQKAAAKETNSGFWNLYQAMGGKNSMVSFVSAQPPLAQKDYTHFNAAGTDKIADLFVHALMKVYETEYGHPVQ